MVGLLAKEGSAADGHLTGNLATSEGGGTLGETDVSAVSKGHEATLSLFYPLSKCSWN